MKFYQRGPNLEVNFRYTKFFLASDPPPHPPPQYSINQPLSKGLVSGPGPCALLPAPCDLLNSAEALGVHGGSWSTGGLCVLPLAPFGPHQSYGALG